MSWSSYMLSGLPSLSGLSAAHPHAKRDRLKVEAGRAAQRRNHQLGPWSDLDNEKAAAVCEVCGKEAYVDGKPAPNGIDVSGEAVALDCPRGPIRCIKISYDIVTLESAVEGDFVECGWEDEEGVCIDPDADDVEEHGSELAAVVALAIQTIGNGVEPSSYPECVPGNTWYIETDGESDYEDGSVKRLSYHLDNFTEEEELAIYAELIGK